MPINIHKPLVERKLTCYKMEIGASQHTPTLRFTLFILQTELLIESNHGADRVGFKQHAELVPRACA